MGGMSVSLVVSAGLGWLLTAAPRILPCAPDTPGWTEARDGLAAFDKQVDALADGDTVAPLRPAMIALRDLRCFALAREEDAWLPVSEPDSGEQDVSALALKTWWRDGGKAFFASHLELGRPGPHTVVNPPELRAVLTREHSKGHRLEALACPTKADACGMETGPWRARAEQAFRPEFLRDGQLRASAKDRPRPPDCAARARKQPAKQRYKTWRECLADAPGALPVLPALPLGRIRAPMDGWLVVRGRRGHHAFCDQLDAFHLVTGATYEARSCGGLALQSQGRVDVVRTEAARRSEVRVGRVDPERLRELTWMLLLAPEVQADVQVEALRTPVPKDFRIEWTATNLVGGVQGGMFGGSSGQTRLNWSWFPSGGAEPWSGTWTYPWSWAVGEDYVNELLEDAEATFQEGCPRQPVPSRMMAFTREPAVHGLDAPNGVGRVQDALVEDLNAWRPPPGCVPGADGG
ncbi:hypothetical protein D7Y13_18140 [Corallococcus praedator]|uniref:YARHG domain-containing protein n=2 Tax=Myxococcaceae TaxID=31 RepID=A0ABX9QHH9_9BACT|nr:hypothetical protein D7X75_05925 [Corallococcus sp. CA031C]RKI07342.1 hypothetical protein D7Y13_18140 [Corallococcus praedator]